MSDTSILVISVASLIAFGFLCDTLRAIFVAKYENKD